MSWLNQRRRVVLKSHGAGAPPEIPEAPSIDSYGLHSHTTNAASFTINIPGYTTADRIIVFAVGYGRQPPVPSFVGGSPLTLLGSPGPYNNWYGRAYHAPAGLGSYTQMLVNYGSISNSNASRWFIYTYEETANYPSGIGLNGVPGSGSAVTSVGTSAFTNERCWTFGFTYSNAPYIVSAFPNNTVYQLSATFGGITQNGVAWVSVREKLNRTTQQATGDLTLTGPTSWHNTNWYDTNSTPFS